MTSVWIEGKVRIGRKSEENTRTTLEKLARLSFPGAAKYEDHFHSTLLYIGTAYPVDKLVPVFEKQGVGDFVFRGSNYVPILGGENDEKILLTYECPEQCLLFRRVYDAYKAAGYKPEHQLRNASRWLCGFTPHVTLATFEDSATAKRSLEHGRNQIVNVLMRENPNITLDEFHLFKDKNKKGKQVVV